MKNGHLFGIILVISVFTAVFGCTTIEYREVPVEVPVEIRIPVEVPAPQDNFMPLTVGILNRLLEADIDIRRCQFIISGRVLLERNEEEEWQSLTEGTAIFEDRHTRNHITIEDQTGGQAFGRQDTDNNEVELRVGFDEYDEYYLTFSAGGGDHSQFHLKFAPHNDPFSDARGMLEYGGSAYQLRFSGGTPFLMVDLSRTGESKREQHTARGQRVGPARTSDEPFVPLTAGNLNRLQEAPDFILDQCQFFLSGRIQLERDENVENVALVGGTVVFQDNHTRTEIIFNDQTAGIALEKIDKDGEIELYMSFEEDRRFQLIFVSKGEDASQFLLKFDASTDPFMDARGTIDYGGQTYRLRFSGGMPFLTLNLAQREREVENLRTAPGRRVGSP